jgi:D-glycero-D-manno-heptose 1,7-bisphosphate phosphatase
MEGMKKERAVFLDRDGTINEEVGYLDSLAKLKLFHQSFAAIKKINKSGMKAVVITNQSGVARGYFSDDFVSEVHLYIQKILGKKGVHIDAFYHCPHHPSEGREGYRKTCNCRKPETGLLLQAATDMNIDIGRSYMVGDTNKDIETAMKVGAKSVLVRTGYGRETEEKLLHSGIIPDYIADDILDAVSWIMKDCQE